MRQKFLWVEGKLENGMKDACCSSHHFTRSLCAQLCELCPGGQWGVSQGANCGTHGDGQTVPGAKAEYCGKKQLEVGDFQ